MNGYRITDIGKIPCDWEIKKLRDCTKKNLTYGINAPAVNYDSKLPQYIRITDITDDGYYDETNRVSVDNEDADRYVVHEGDILLARTGASTGKSYLYRVEDGRLVYAGFLISASIDRDKADERFIFAQLHTERYWKWVESTSQRSGQPGINGKEYGEYLLAFPKKAEQTSIANAISDIENLISTQEALIAKKQAIKQGAMQDLLTGKRRLAGFREKWNRVTLGDIGGLYKGSGISRADMGTGDIAAIRYGELYTFYGAYTHEINTRISAEVAEEAFGLQYGDIVFAGSGETHEEIGKCTAYVLDEKAYAGGDTIILRPNVKCHSVYLGYLLNTSQVQEQKAALGQGDAVVHISAKSLSTIEVELPKYEEQVAIGEMLLDIDNDIANQQAKLEKLRRIKSGMMDKLLTGKIRLTD